jgi:C1A family cysteine protease
MAKEEIIVRKPKTMVQNGRILNCIPSRETHRDWRFKHAVGAGDIPDPEKSGSIPKSKDLREEWWKIGDQEKTGSCVGWATADSVLRWHFVKARRLAKDAKLSVRFIWMAAKETDEYNDYPSTFLELEGTSPKAALDIARNYGSVEESVLPFQPETLYDGEPETFLAKASRFKILKYINMSNNENEPPDWDKVRAWIANKGPVLTRLDVDETWFENEAGALDVYKNPYNAGHAVALVGYTPDTFIVRNSWGTEWGDGGYGHASLEYARDAFTEAYGVTIIP